MPKRISLPEPVLYRLTDFDPSGETTATFFPARRGENARVSQIAGAFVRSADPATGRVEMRPTFSRETIRARQLHLSLGECNVLDPAGEPLFYSHEGRLAMPFEAFEAVLDRLPPDLFEELYEKCVEVNPQWALAALSD